MSVPPITNIANVAPSATGDVPVTRGDANDRYTAALSYLRRGWAVIPLHWVAENGTCSCADGPNPCGGDSAGKHPMRKKWTAGDALRDSDLYGIWMEETPHANIGLRTGPISGFWVLDIDPKSGGFASLQKLIDDLGPLPTTYVVRTGSGGYHYYFATPDFPIRNSANRELLARYGPGLDIRGDGGQVVAAGSRTDHGEYVVQVDAAVGTAPAALLALLHVETKAEVDTPPIEDLPTIAELDSATASRAQNYAEKTLPAIIAEYRNAGPGTGNDTLFRSACSTIEIVQSPWNTFTVAQVKALLFDAARKRREARLNPKGGQDDAEFEQVWRSARNRTVGQGRALPVNPSEELAFDPFPGAVTADPFAAPATVSVVVDVTSSTSHISIAAPASAVEATSSVDTVAAPPAERVVTEPAAAPSVSVTETEDAPKAHVLPTLPKAFYERRGWLTKLREYACKRMESPDAVLGSYLARAASKMPAGLHMDTSIGSPLTASLYVILVGASGNGKTGGDAVAEMLYREKIQPKGLSTGEGLIEAFWGIAKTQDAETMKWSSERTRTSTNELFILDEGKALMQLVNRVGNITGEVLRTAWSGGNAGQHNATRELQRQLDARTYNLGLIMGMQHEVAADLLRDTDTGMAQRFLWFSVLLGADAVYVTGDSKPFDDVLGHPVHPDYVQFAPPVYIGGSVSLDLTPMNMTLEEGIREDLRWQYFLKKTGQLVVDPIDSQRPASIGKLAMVLAYLDGANHVTKDTWDLATQIYSTSAMVRDHVLELAAERKRDDKLVVAHDRAREKQAVNRYGNDQVETIRKVLGWISGGKITRRQITQNTKGAARRELLIDVLDQLVKNGHLREVDAGNQQIKYERITDWTP